MGTPVLTPGMEFSLPHVLRGLEHSGRQFSINAAATVESRVIKTSDRSELITWTAQPRTNAGSNWLVSVPMVVFNSTLTGALTVSHVGDAIVETRVQGEIMDQDQTLSGVTYDRRWSDSILIGDPI